MQKIYLLFFLFLTATCIKAQNASDYFFKVKSGVALENISSGSTQIFGNNQDGVSSDPISLPFSFQFSGTTYNQFSVSTDGIIGLGSTPVTNRVSVTDNIITGSNTYPIIMPWTDILTTANGSISYKVLGVAGNRKLVIEYKGVKTYKEFDDPDATLTFQIWLSEATQAVQFVYGIGYSWEYDNTSVGIAASGSNYKSVTTNDNSVSSTNANAYNTIWPGTGASYIFSPSDNIPVYTTITVNNEPTVTNPTCNGAGNGSISLTNITGGDGNYVISWNGPNYTGSGASITGLKAGIYNYSITDGAQNFPATGIVEITEPVVLTAATSDEVNVKCNGESNGSFTVSASGGTAPYSYVLNGNSSDNGVFTNLPAGTYTVNVTDAHGCTVAVSHTVAQPTAITATSTAKDANCNATSSGSVTAIGSGGSAPYSYTLAGTTNTTGIFTNLTAGAYTITVADAHGCTTTTTSTVKQQTGLILSVPSITNAKCNNENNGAIAVTATGGTQAYLYTLKGTTSTGTSINQSNSTGTFSSLYAGNYMITVTNGNTCPASVSAIVAQPVATTSVTNVSCYGSSNGSASVAVTGTANTYYYAWLNSSNNLISTSATVSGLSAGNYTVISYDVNKCYIIGQASITQPLPVTASAAVTSNYSGAQISCSASADGSVKINGAGGSGNYTYTLYTTPTKSVSNATGVFTNLAAGTYSYTVKDIKGCNPVSGSVKITAPTAISATVTLSPARPLAQGQLNTIYLGYGAQSVTLSATKVTGGTVTSAGYSYSWSPSTGLSNTHLANPTATPTVTTTYTVTVKDANGCSVARSITVYVVDLRWYVNSQEAKVEAPTELAATNTVAGELVATTTTASVYPNPSREQFNVNINQPTATKITITIVDANGKAVMQKDVQPSGGAQTVNINLGDKAPGIYLIRVVSDKGIQTSKVLIQH